MKGPQIEITPREDPATNSLDQKTKFNIAVAAETKWSAHRTKHLVEAEKSFCVGELFCGLEPLATARWLSRERRAENRWFIQLQPF